ncbi:MAG: hypothetical protein ABIF85_06700 [Nanoarchaeota archaeon]|nr:hypothetical protein [Nanoarchaeota archaeon]MBU4299960.1 hypothetical protein [Nanoarchaeota archaeon]MBU4452235.1 hypothetical protein [Nanoarchaeota archaeon]MCG2723662.1 hypothetical protein [archaeon]
MLRFRNRKKAIVTADMAVALVIFVLMLSIAFYYLSYLSKPKQPFEATLKAEGALIGEKLVGNTTWTVYKLPVWVESTVTGNASFELFFYPDPYIDLNSIAMQDENSTEIPSSFLDNHIVWISNVTLGKSLFYLTYLKSSGLDATIYDTGLLSSEQ